MSDRLSERLQDPNDPTPSKAKRRGCCFPGCTKIVKSKGLCQRHGATSKRCKVEGCARQAQGSLKGMCTAHFKSNTGNIDAAKSNIDQNSGHDVRESIVLTPPIMNSSVTLFGSTAVTESVYKNVIPASLCWRWTSTESMPFVQFLELAIIKGMPLGWHRNSERAVRGKVPIMGFNDQFEKWEIDLIWEEILLLTGHPSLTFSYLAFAWGQRDKFHVNFSLEQCRSQLNVPDGIKEERITTNRNHITHHEIPASLKLSFMAFLADTLTGSILDSNNPNAV